MYLCTYADCRVPHERHDSCAADGLGKCWPGVPMRPDGSGGITGSGDYLSHQHTPKRSQGGKECHVLLCAGHHDAIDNGVRYEGLRIADRIHDFREWGEERSGPPHKIYEIYLRDSGEILKSIPL